MNKVVTCVHLHLRVHQRTICHHDSNKRKDAFKAGKVPLLFVLSVLLIYELDSGVSVSIYRTS